MKTAILTGATGFLGYWLLTELREKGVFVYAICRPNSPRLYKVSGLSNVQIIELDMCGISEMVRHVKTADVFYHLAWEGDRNDFMAQIKNVHYALDAMRTASTAGVRHFISTGSQAEYGVCDDEIDEKHVTNPVTAYGACKLSTYFVLKTLAKQLDIAFTWVRVFSVYGEDDGFNTLLISYLVKCFKENITPEVSACENLWDFLYAKDAANALFLFGEKDCRGLYNLAYGESRKLRDFIIMARNLLSVNSRINFDPNKAASGVQLSVNISKIKNDLGWTPKTPFAEGITKLEKQIKQQQ